jgi:hypothetical protein
LQHVFSATFVGLKRLVCNLCCIELDDLDRYWRDHFAGVHAVVRVKRRLDCAQYAYSIPMLLLQVLQIAVANAIELAPTTAHSKFRVTSAILAQPIARRNVGA